MIVRSEDNMRTEERQNIYTKRIENCSGGSGAKLFWQWRGMEGSNCEELIGGKTRGNCSAVMQAPGIFRVKVC
jgi:hypothetical protein